MLLRVAQWVVPAMDFSGGAWWIVDDTGFPKQGVNSVGVARPYCGLLGKQDNCQAAVSGTLACHTGSLQVAWQLYLAKDWGGDMARSKKSGPRGCAGNSTSSTTAAARVFVSRSVSAPKPATWRLDQVTGVG